MAHQTLARRYAIAIFGLAKDQSAIQQVGHDLHTVVDTLAIDETIRKFYRSPVVDRKEKATIIGTAFDKLNAIALHSILLLVRKRRENMLEEIVTQYDVLEQQSRGAAPLRIETARELSKPELDALVARLSECYKTT